MNAPLDAEQYLATRVDPQIAWLSRQAAWNQRCFKRLRVAELVLATSIPLLAGYADAHFVKFLIGALGATVAVIAGIMALYKFQENWTDYRTTCESLKRERYLFATRTAPYEGDDAYAAFVRTVEEHLANEHQGWAERMAQSVPEGAAR